MISNIIKAVEENIKDSDAELIVNAPDITPDNAEEILEEPEKLDMKDQTDNIQSIDIYKVQLKRDRSLKSFVLSILKYLSEDILREESDFSSIKSNDKEMNVDEENNEDGEVESTLPEKTDSTSNSKSKKRANEYTDFLVSKKSKKHDLDENFNILKRLIRELSSDTTRISITNTEERNEKARYELIITYYHYGEELEKCLVHYREGYKEHEALKKLYDEVKNQLLKEVIKNAIQKKSNRARK
ncbi:14656_t:CDS:2 [Funneliformis mosseae]|uniref:14656_t:CDS:1 n=1 Tax=Funneliformis mosseae TaxID=27381 RepID=A0A9N8ZYB9_FUNMO|nr:14656_t:CDS:2 [Funneliformis mosseae]